MYNCNSDFIYLIHIETCSEPFLQYTVKIDKDLNLTVNMEKTPVKKISTYSFPLKVNSYNDILHVLDFLEQNYSNSEKSPNLIIDTIINLLDQISLKENENCIKFIQEQLKLIISHKNNFRYSTDLLIFASLLKSISPHAYKFIRSSNIVKLPHPCTLQRICNNFNLSPQLEMLDENFLMYIRNRVYFIENHEKIVTLLLDEIHVKSLFDYKGGSIVGADFNSEKAANSAFVFMISSILSQFKEVVHIMPVHTINF